MTTNESEHLIISARALCSLRYPNPLSSWRYSRYLDWDTAVAKEPKIVEAVESASTEIKAKLGGVDIEVIKQYFAYAVNVTDKERTNHAKS